ncbi:hypothetical protein CBF_3282 [Clostridium botulinum F str. 230613]|nr:hypothetical protein CBF_3282 [Clostridium botulinum F str. 230613]
MEQISEMSKQLSFQEQIVGASGSLAKISALPENREGSKESVQVCFSQLQDLMKIQKKKINPSTYLLRTLKTYLVLTEGLTSPDFSLKWTKSGMMQNGRLLTQEISEFHRTGKECSLLDILEKEVPEKYFLSQEQVNRLVFL